MKHLIFDSFALIALFRDEPGAARVEAILASVIEDPDIRGWITSVNLGEVFYMLARKVSLSDAEAALLAIRQFRLQVTDADEATCLQAARLKAAHRISYADAFAAALTIRLKGTLISGDREFKSLEKLPHFKVEYIKK